MSTYSWKQNSAGLWVGVVISLFGIILRACAEIKLEANFTHVIRRERVNSHQLITTGVYSWFRHPSYTGWFYFCLGREVILNNIIGVILVAFMNWSLLYYRIP